MAALRSRRLSRGWLIAAAVLALAGLYAVGSNVTWLLAMAEAPDTRPLAVWGAGGALAGILLAIAIPLFKAWEPSLWLRVVIIVLALVFGVAAAVQLWLLAVTTACDYQCRPADTWTVLPALITCGLLTGLAPGVQALAHRGEPTEKWWVLTAVAVLAGFAVALFNWVEGGIY